MDAEEHFGGAFGGPGPQDIANGTAILASALVREAESLAQATAGLRASIDLLPTIQEEVRRGATLAAALLLAARLLLDLTGDAPRAAAETAARLPRGTITPDAVIGHLRAAALAPVTDDGAARIAAATIAERFAAEFELSWHAVPPAKGETHGI